MAEIAFDLGPAEIFWYDPDPRAMLPLTPEQGLHIPRRLARTFRRQPYRITSDTDFNAVVAMCGDPSRPCVAEDGGWIDEQIRVFAALLHWAGHSHSIEARDDSGRLVGGLFGVSVPGRRGPIFCAESMVTDFDRGTDAGKLCLLHLLRHLHTRGYSGCDVQLANPHTEQFGIVEVSRSEYHSMLDPGAKVESCVWGPFEA